MARFSITDACQSMPSDPCEPIASSGGSCCPRRLQSSCPALLCRRAALGTLGLPRGLKTQICCLCSGMSCWWGHVHSWPSPPCRLACRFRDWQQTIPFPRPPH